MVAQLAIASYQLCLMIAVLPKFKFSDKKSSAGPNYYVFDTIGKLENGVDFVLIS